jgi:hypothetical protein
MREVSVPPGCSARLEQPIAVAVIPLWRFSPVTVKVAPFLYTTLPRVMALTEGVVVTGDFEPVPPPPPQALRKLAVAIQIRRKRELSFMLEYLTN